MRDLIIAEMKAYEEMQRQEYGNRYNRNRDAQFCTWWFTRRLMVPNRAIRAELKRMEREGLVTADRRYPNNTQWLLTVKEISND